MKHDTAVDIMIASYQFLYCSTYTAEDIEAMMISELVRKGASKSSARKWVLDFLDS